MNLKEEGPTAGSRDMVLVLCANARLPVSLATSMRQQTLYTQPASSRALQSNLTWTWPQAGPWLKAAQPAARLPASHRISLRPMRVNHHPTIAQPAYTVRTTSTCNSRPCDTSATRPHQDPADTSCHRSGHPSHSRKLAFSRHEFACAWRAMLWCSGAQRAGART